MTTGYYTNVIEELMPDGYSYEVHCLKKGSYRVCIYNHGHLIHATGEESLTFSFNAIAQYFKTLQTLKK